MECLTMLMLLNQRGNPQELTIPTLVFQIYIFAQECRLINNIMEFYS